MKIPFQQRGNKKQKSNILPGVELESSFNEQATTGRF